MVKKAGVTKVMADKVISALTDSIAESLADGKKGACCAGAVCCWRVCARAAVASAEVIDPSPVPAYTPHATPVSLVGFGSFATSVRSARTARNPRTGEPIQVPETTVATFAPSKALKDKVNHRTP